MKSATPGSILNWQQLSDSGVFSDKCTMSFCFPLPLSRQMKIASSLFYIDQPTLRAFAHILIISLT
jgi:hypothetical protein